MKNESLVPKIRFKGFSDPWEQRKLPEIAERLSKSSNNKNLPRIEYADIVSGMGRLKKNVSMQKSSDDRAGIRFSSHNILYGKLRPYLNNWLFPNFSGVAIGDFWVFQARKNISASFLFTLIQSPKYQQISNVSTGTKMPRSDWKKVSSIDFEVPNSFSEQEEMGNYFLLLDNLIAANEDKLNQLKELKKLMMQKIFSQEWRFKGFTDPWEQRKLGEVTSQVKSYPITREKECTESNLEYVHYGDIHKLNNTIIDEETPLPTVEDNGKYSLLNEGDLVLADASEDYVEIAKPLVLYKINDRRIIAGLHTIALRPKRLESLFLYNVLQNQSFRKYGYRVGTGLKVFGISAKNVFEYTFLAPSQNEQREIDQILKSVTDLIAANEEKLMQLKELKKYLMQNMFV